MKVVIIEDEEAAAGRLKKVLLELDPTLEILATLESIERAVSWFKSNTSPNVIFADIQLADGPSFEIFKSVNITAPVIFITAYDAYALDAFKFNGIDYLLKPIKKAEVEKSLKKYKQFQNIQPPPVIDYHDILAAVSGKKSTYRNSGCSLFLHRGKNRFRVPE
jgi:two-component SAPR family response regulator